MRITVHAWLHNSFKAHGVQIQMAHIYGESCYLLTANLAALNLLTGRVCVVGSGSDGSPAVRSSTSPNTYKTVITMSLGILFYNDSAKERSDGGGKEGM